MIFSLYFRTLLSLSISFLLHAFNFNKHLHSFLTLLTTFNNNTSSTTNTNIATTTTDINNNNNKGHLKRQIDPTPLVLPPNPIHMVCTESIGFESTDERIVVDDQDHDESDEDEFEDGNCLRMKTVAERRENVMYKFPPPLSSLDGNGHRNFILLPVRMNGRLQLSKVRVKRSEIICSTRENGRLRLYLVPEYSSLDEEEEEMEEEEEVEEVVEEEEEELEEVVESEVEEEMIMGEKKEEEEESSRNDDRDRGRNREAREWKLRGLGGGGDNESAGGLIIRRCHSVGDNERLIRKCRQMVNLNYSSNGIHYRHNLYGSHHNLHMFGVGVGIA